MTTYTNSTPAQAKHRSYRIADELADLLGYPDGHDLRLENHLVWVQVDGVVVDAWLLRTTNAGFRGIEGTFEFADGSRRIMSLGHITCSAA